MVFSIFARLCNNHHFLILEHFNHSPKNRVSISSYFPSPRPKHWHLLIPPFFSGVLLVLVISCKWNHPVCGFLWLTDFHLTCVQGVVQAWISTLFIVMDKSFFIIWLYHILLIHSTIHGYLCYSHILLLWILLWKVGYKLLSGHMILVLLVHT